MNQANRAGKPATTCEFRNLRRRVVDSEAISFGGDFTDRLQMLRTSSVEFHAKLPPINRFSLPIAPAQR